VTRTKLGGESSGTEVLFGAANPSYDRSSQNHAIPIPENN
jgi:hypothetical protein